MDLNATGFATYREAVAAGAGATISGNALTELAQVGAMARSDRDEQVAIGTSYRYVVAAKGSGGLKAGPTAQEAGPLQPEPEPGPGDTPIADNVVGPGTVATVTSIGGTIEGYGGWRGRRHVRPLGIQWFGVPGR